MTVILVCTTGALTAYVPARKKIRRWKIVTFYLLATTTAPIQLFLFPHYFGFARLGLINNPVAVAPVYTSVFSPVAIMLLGGTGLPEMTLRRPVDGGDFWWRPR